MKRLKLILPILFFAIMVIGSLTILTTNSVEAQDGEPNCNINDVDYICRDTASVDCLCVDKPGEDPDKE